MNALSEDDFMPRAVVVGAGIAGLTAATELAERGFEVEVVDADAYDDPSTQTVRPFIGGMARSQFAKIRFGSAAATASSSLLTTPVAFDNTMDSTEFEEAATEIGLGLAPSSENVVLNITASPLVRLKAASIATAERTLRSDTIDRLRAPLPGEPAPPSGTSSTEKTVRNLIKVLERLEKTPGYDADVSLVFQPFFARDIVTWVGRVNAVNYFVVRTNVGPEQIIYAEHGFRFFPSFYRHLFATMERIPLLEERWDPATSQHYVIESPRRVIDNLVPTRDLRFGMKAPRRTFSMTRRKPETREEVKQQLRNLLIDAGYEPKDIARLGRRLYQFATSSRHRRTSELEHITWADFLKLDELVGKLRDHIVDAPQALVAMNAEESDARTIGAITLQLLKDQFVDDDDYVDGVLNGPTTFSLLHPWRDYLEFIGVTFTAARMTGFQRVPNGATAQNAVAIRPKIIKLESKPGDDPPGLPDDPADYEELDPAEYYVVTMPVDKLQAMERDAGSANKLMTLGQTIPDDDWFDLKRALLFNAGNDFDAYPDGNAGSGALRYMVGVQLYFDTDVDLAGHTMAADSPWGISLISQQQVWTERLADQQYKGVVSTIITRFTKEARVQDGSMKKAKDCTPEEIAWSVWNQIRQTLDDGAKLPDYRYFYIDHALDFGKDAAGNPTMKNKTPYLVALVDEWDKRPGVDAPGPDGERRYKYPLQLVPALPNGDLAKAGTVLAGVLMGTHTRLTSMEAANESARRAVNAVLLRESGEDEAKGVPADGRYQLCRTWDHESLEFPDLRDERSLDGRLSKAGRRHVLEGKLADIAMHVMPWDALRLFSATKRQAVE